MPASPAETVRAARMRIARDEPMVRAWASLADPAELPDAPVRGGLLAGVGIGVKDIIDTADFVTERGSPLFAGRRPALDATVVARLRSHGAVVVGKTVTTVFGMRDPGPTTNPHDAARTPGGSSSGSAAAVAAGHVDLTIGTQTGGSVVRPAAYCGVYGIKPTGGAIDRFGLMLHCASVDTVGFLGRDPEILARAFVAATRPAPHVPTSDLGSGPVRMLLPPTRLTRLRFLRSRRDEVLEPGARSAIDSWLESVRARGDLQVEFVETPFDDMAMDDLLRKIVNFEAARLLDGMVQEHGDAVGAHVMHLVGDGRSITVDDYRAALVAVAVASAQLDEWLGDGFVVAPSARGVAPIGLHSTGSAEYCRMWSLLGNPTVNVPGLTADGTMPFGIQVATARGSDLRALAVAREVGKLMPDGDPGSN